MEVKVKDLFGLDFISRLCTLGYAKTQRKFDVQFVGSKGYFNHIEINCEMNNKWSFHNRIERKQIFKANGDFFKKVKAKIYLVNDDICVLVSDIYGKYPNKVDYPNFEWEHLLANERLPN